MTELGDKAIRSYEGHLHPLEHLALVDLYELAKALPEQVQRSQAEALLHTLAHHLVAHHVVHNDQRDKARQSK